MQYYEKILCHKSWNKVPSTRRTRWKSIALNDIGRLVKTVQVYARAKCVLAVYASSKSYAEYGDQIDLSL